MDGTVDGGVEKGGFNSMLIKTYEERVTYIDEFGVFFSFKIQNMTCVFWLIFEVRWKQDRRTESFKNRENARKQRRIHTS